MGIGWYPVAEAAQPYGREYWKRYIGYDMTPVGIELTNARMDMVDRHWSGELVDIGIGGGRFVRERPNTKGYDINLHASAWLKSIGLWRDPYAGRIQAASFWDSLEHIADPAPLLANVIAYVFMSLPIFDGPDHVLRSKHYRKDEHYWYFTEPGLQHFMRRHGFEFVESSHMEQDCGREDIGSFVFRRIGCY